MYLLGQYLIDTLEQLKDIFGNTNGVPVNYLHICSHCRIHTRKLPLSSKNNNSFTRCNYNYIDNNKLILSA